MPDLPTKKFLSIFKNIFDTKVSIKFLFLIFCISALPFLVFYFDKLNENVNYTSKDEGLGIKDIIKKLRTELGEWRNERLARKEDPMFQIKSLDLEVNFVIKTQLKQNGKVEYEFVAVEAGKQVDREKTQKITLHMEVIPAPRIHIEPATKPIQSKPSETVIIERPN